MFGKKKKKSKGKNPNLGLSLKDAKQLQPSAGGQTPPAHKKMAQTLPAPEVRSSKIMTSTSMASARETPSPSASAILRMDEHKQLKEMNRPEEAGHSSDPDTSLYEYDDDRDLTNSLRRTITLPYGSQVLFRESNRNSNANLNHPSLSDFSHSEEDEDTAVDTVSSPKFLESAENPGVVEDVIFSQRQSLVTSSLPHSLHTIPRSGSPVTSKRPTPHTSLRQSGTSLRQSGGSTGGILKNSLQDPSLRESKVSDNLASLRASFDSTIRIKENENNTLRRSVDDAETRLSSTTKGLEGLISEKSRAATPEQKVDYYERFEGHISETLKDQEEVIELLKQRLDVVEAAKEEMNNFTKLQENESQRLKGRLEEECRNLKQLVYKLNQQINVCQIRHQKITDVNGNAFKPLPTDAPTPAWMINHKYLSPLIKTYEDQISVTTQELTSLRRKFAKYENDIKALIEENAKLRQGLKSGGLDTDSIDKATWQQLQQHARLVLDENEILIKEMDLQDDKMAEMQKRHFSEMSDMETKLRTVEAERNHRSEEVIELKCQVNQRKSQVEELKAANQLRVDKIEHMRVVTELEMKLETVKETTDMDLELQREKNSKLFQEKVDLESRINAFKNEVRENEIERRTVSKQTTDLEVELIKKEKELKKANQALAELLVLTDQVMVDKNALKNVLKCEKLDKKKSVGAIMESELLKERLMEQMKKYKVKTEKQLDKLVAKLEKKDGEFDLERREYERQIKHLRQLVHEKDVQCHDAFHDKREVEDCLEFVWLATQADNHDITNTLRKSVRRSRELRYPPDQLENEDLQ